MINWFKNHLIPHEGNDHRPHILRDASIRNIVLLVIFLEITTFLLPTLSNLNRTGGMAAVLPAVLANLTNEERQDQNLKTLTVNKSLNEAADMKAKDMATKGYFAHVSPDGKTPWYWIEKVGYKYQYAGENLAINFSDSIDVTNAWMASPTHKANIIKGNYTEIGTGVATGIYKGKETIFVAQVYANPLSSVVEKTEPTKKETNKLSKLIKTEESTNVLGAQADSQNTNIEISENLTKNDSPQKITFLEKTLTSPRNTTNIILYIIFGIVFTALLLYVFIKIKNHHKNMITNGLVLIAIIVAIFIANYYLSYHNMVVIESYDYSVDSK